MNTQQQESITADMSAYISVMEEIKRRTAVVWALINQEINMMYNVTQAESMALQIRMIIESIALASLAAHKSLFEKENNKFKKLWDVHKIFKAIEKKNPGFYPKPVKETPSNTPGVKSEIADIEEGFMTRNEIIKVHIQCCHLLHAKNPYAQQRNYEGFIAQVPNWMDRIKKLLNSHQIKLLNDDGFYLVHMREAARGDRAHMYYFGAAPPHIQRQFSNAASETNDPI